MMKRRRGDTEKRSNYITVTPLRRVSGSMFEQKRRQNEKDRSDYKAL